MFHFTALLFVILIHLNPLNGQSCSGKQDEKNDKPAAHTNIVLVGATGDLATKYLWNGLFNLFSTYYNETTHHFSIYACARKSADEGRGLLSKILLNTIKCKSDVCRQNKIKFVQATQYHQLKTENHYKELGKKVNENTQSLYGLLDTEFSTEEGRMVYLSIPPSSYVKTAKYVHKYLRPQYGHPYFRLVLEKPFGNDLKSAQSLVDSLAKDFKEHEIYRIDHYLGKTVVNYILPFRQINKNSYKDLWNNNHIERVEIVMKESLDVKGRVSFYDEVGVIRDVMQNHLTEILSLVTMETPDDSSHIGQILRNKLSVLECLFGSGVSKTVLGQYAAYISEAVNDLDKPDYISKTPTFAASLLSIENTRWSNVPILMIAGKKLDSKASYVRIVFKDTKFCISDQVKCEQVSGQIIFVIGSNDVHKPPMVMVSKTLPKPKETSGWKFSEMKLNSTILGVNVSDMYILQPDNENDAYTTLLEAVYNGQRHMFTDTKSLLASWKLWTPILHQLSESTPRSYDGQDPEWMDIQIDETKRVYFVNKDKFMDIPEDGDAQSGKIPTVFREQRLIVKNRDDIIEELCNVIYNKALESIENRGSFHIAFSGGRSSPYVLGYLSSHFQSFPWHKSHVWQVDERCVDDADSRRNFYLIEHYLLKNLPYIPHSNIHKMPVKLGQGFCDPDDNGSSLYENELHMYCDSILDFVILGVGTDAHTASLFPNSDVLNNYSNTVALSQDNKRMTLTYKALNEARHVVILATGKEKHDVIDKIAGVGDKPIEYPITGVKSDIVEWYLDYDAWFGKL